MKKTNLFALSAAALIGAAGLVSCGETPVTSSSSTPTSSSAVVSSSAAKETTKMTACIASEPATMDPALNSTVDGATYAVHLFSGLYGYHPDSTSESGYKLEKELAETVTKATARVVDHEQDGDSWKEVVYEEGTRYTIKIREGLKWSDGSDFTIDDIIYSWNRASGSTLAADYGYMFECIADGVAHETDDSAYPSLAIAKVDDHTMTIDLMTDVAYFDQLLAFPTYFPVKKSVVEANPTRGGWAASVDTYVSNGAYVLDAWVSDSYIRLKKNPLYWNADAIKMDEITFALSSDDAATLVNYNNGSYQMIDNVPTESIDALRNNADFHIAGQMGTYYICFNVNGDKLGKTLTEAKKEKLRHALGLFIDRQDIVDNITKTGQIPANAFVSKGISDADGSQFVDHNGVNGDGSGYFNVGSSDAEYEANIAEAIATLKELGYNWDDTAKKFTDFPTFTYLYNTGNSHQKIGEAIHNTFAAYGIDMSLSNEEWNTFLEERKKGNYDVARNGWVADYDDPSSYLTMWTTNSGNNDTQFGRGAHAEYKGFSVDLNNDGVLGEDEQNLTWAQSYDVLIDKSNKESNATTRFKELHHAEDLLMQTGAICPLYFYTDLYMLKTNVTGFFSTPLGYKFFAYCEITK